MKALFVGLGGVGQRHLRNLRRLRPDAQLLAVRGRGRRFEIRDDLTPDESVDVAEKYGIRVLPDLDAAVAERPDLAVVSNPTSLHVPTALKLAGAGVPVLLEKPVSDSEAGLDELVRASRERRAPVMVGYMMRFHPCVERLRALLGRGAVGPVHSANLVCHSFVPSWHRYEAPKDFYAGSRALGGGVVLTEIHELDLLHSFFGPARRVFALGGKRSAVAMDVEDAASALIEFAPGGRPFAATVDLSFVQPAPTRRLEVFGEEGRVVWDALAQRVELRAGARPPEVFETPDFPRNDLFVRELEHFLSCLASGRGPEPSLEDALVGHRTALRIRSLVLDAQTEATRA